MRDRLLRALTSRGWRHGVKGGSTVWLVLGAAGWAAKRLRRGKPEVVYSEELGPGERVEISHLTESSLDLRARRRSLRRSTP